LSLDATHLGVCVSVGQSATTSEDELLIRRLQRERIRMTASSELARSEGWSIAMIEEDVILVRTYPSSSDALDRLVTAELESLVTTLRRDFGSINLYFGLGTAQSGLTGIQQSTKEARVAAGAAATEGTAWMMSTFDATGVNRLLAEMSSSWAGRRVISELLAPLDALGTARSQSSVETLVAYLDARGSLVEAGRILHLHPNAVAYRIRRIR
jgi:sugar diacid utilization regulator